MSGSSSSSAPPPPPPAASAPHSRASRYFATTLLGEVVPVMDSDDSAENEDETEMSPVETDQDQDDGDEDDGEQEDDEDNTPDRFDQDESVPEDAVRSLPNGVDLSCAVCFSVPVPTTAQEHTACGRLFCRGCLEQWLLSTPDAVCPFCKKPLEQSCRRCQTENLSVYRLLRGLQVCCPYAGRGCSRVVELGDVAAHVGKCEFARIACPNVGFGCRAVLERRYMAGHLELCVCRVQPCVHCGESVTAAQMTEHLESGCSACPTTMVQCPVRGCGESVQRAMMSEHHRSEVVKHVALLFNQVTSLERMVHTLSVCEFEAVLRVPRPGGAEESVVPFYAVGVQWRLEMQVGSPPQGSNAEAAARHSVAQEARQEDNLSVFLCNVQQVPCCVTFTVSASLPNPPSRGVSPSQYSSLSPAAQGLAHRIENQRFPDGGYWTWGWPRFALVSEFGNPAPQELEMRVSVKREW